MGSGQAVSLLARPVAVCSVFGLRPSRGQTPKNDRAPDVSSVMCFSAR